MVHRLKSAGCARLSYANLRLKLNQFKSEWGQLDQIASELLTRSGSTTLFHTMPH